MIRLAIALARSLPLVIILILLAIGLYFFLAWRKSPTRAKEILIKVFIVICSAIAIAFGLISGYALLDGNIAVLELAASCAIIGIIGLVVTLICRYVFRKHHPHYKFEPTEKARPITNKPDMLSTVTNILNFINDNRRKR